MKNSSNIIPLHESPEQTKHSRKKKSLQYELKSINRKKLIKLRAKKIKDGSYSLYLHLRHQDKQEYHFLKLYIHGKKETVKTDEENLRLALSIRDKKELEIFQNDYDFQLYNQNSKADFIEYFDKVVQTKVKTDGTIDKSWKHTLKHLKIFTKNKPVSFRQIDDKFCERFRDYLKQAIAANTGHTYFAKLKAALNTAIKDNIITKNPAQFLHISKQEVYREFLTVDELRSLKNTPCLSGQTKNAFLFSCFTGLRISDIKKLTWDEINDGYLVFKQKKTQSIERMKLSQNAKEVLEAQKGQGITSGTVFKLITNSNTRKHITKWVKQAGINKKISWHSGRHTFATLNLTFGNDIYTTSKLLGHKDVKVTQIYAKLIDQKKDEAIDKLPVI